MFETKRVLQKDAFITCNNAVIKFVIASLTWRAVYNSLKSDLRPLYDVV